MKNRATHANAFTLIELLVVISIIALLIGILLPALGAARRTARQMANSTQVRGIHQGMVTFAQSNKGMFPGMIEGGTIATAPPAFDNASTPAAGADDYWYDNTFRVRNRYAIMLNGNFFTPDYAISPSEQVEAITEATPGSLFLIDNFSYSMSRIGGNFSEGRIAEWQETLNTLAPVLSDRNGGVGAAAAYADDRLEQTSIHVDSPDLATDAPEEWRGTVGWNDNHVGFENSALMETTKYGNFAENIDDNLFGTTDSTTRAESAQTLMQYN